ncbi:hypothetical protein OVA11_19100 [Caulobacter sp. SL161]|uniref:hypothetical protein n=1 Tax=Caulobacter TaxID=75 RepID=UPI0015E7662C|nr:MULTISPECIES: hypothetical protein [Caulobacter]MCY1649086.1 hypothetical protein [Caulobacter sp. SL161]
MSGPIGRVSVARAAELLTAAGDVIERSALSRYCDAHSLKLGKVGREVMVDFEAVRDHRKNNYTRSVMSGEALHSVPATEAAPPTPNPTSAARDEPVKLDEHRQLKAVQLRRELREEAAEEGKLTDVAEVDAGAAEAIVEMRAAFVEVRADFAERLAAELGLPSEKVRTLRAALKRYDRVGQDRFATRIGKALAAGNESTGEALDRLMTLAAHAVRLRAGKANAAVA